MKPPQPLPCLSVEEEAWKNYYLKKYGDIFTRQGRSKHHTVSVLFNDPIIPVQEKGRRIPIHILPNVEQELVKLQKEGHITKLDNCTDDFFIAPIVITAKRDNSIKLALDAKPVNAQIRKNKYQMPNLYELMDSAGQIIANRKPGEQVWFSSLDLNYAYSQIPLSEKTSKHCNFSIVGGKATGTYRFKTGFYGLTDMPTEFQKAMDRILDGCLNSLC